ncbi:unnamed protein product [Phaedon cochleariae]|uniref:Peptidase metallopeptidase domain-containing protein n=1 Tax=Phaedon cochleariae TaxID=80249 RepID=A0A9N9WYK9_PHACE|nr:unnamed protein product [Phaedon cochleariae]
MHRDTAKMAFDRWEELSNLKFENVRNPSRQKPDITLTVIRKNHNFRANCQGTSKCPHNFDGPGKVSAHAFSPNENNKCIEIHLDAEEKWYLGNSTSPDGQTSLLMVLIHEISHALGLGHSDVNTAIMYPWYQASPVSFDIDDKRAIEYLYGQKTENYQPTTTSTTQTTESQKPISQHTSTTASSVSSNEPHNVDVTSTTSKPQITPTRLCDIQVPDFMFLAAAPQFQNYRIVKVVERANTALQGSPQTQSIAKITIESINLKVPHLTPNDDIKLQLLTRIKADESMMIPFRRWKLHELLALTQGSTIEIWSVKTCSALDSPRYVIVFFQTKKADNLHEDVTLFDNANIKSIRLALNSDYYPQERMLLDFSKDQYADAHFNYTEFNKSYHNCQEKRSLVNFAEFKSRPMFVIDCSRRHLGMKSSTVDIK